MKNIVEILKTFGIELPEEKKTEFEREVFSNYKTVAEFDGVKSSRDKLVIDIAQRDKDLTTLQGKLQDAGTSEEKLLELQGEISTLKTNNATEKESYEKQLKQQSYEFIVKEKINGMSFSSKSAKNAFTGEVIGKNLPIENGSLLGFDDFVNQYKQEDARAFATETANIPTFSSKSGAVEKVSEIDTMRTAMGLEREE